MNEQRFCYCGGKPCGPSPELLALAEAARAMCDATSIVFRSDGGAIELTSGQCQALSELRRAVDAYRATLAPPPSQYVPLSPREGEAAAMALVMSHESAIEDLVDALSDMVRMACSTASDNEVQSMAMHSYADAMRLLAKHGRLEIIAGEGRSIRGRWAHGTSRFHNESIPSDGG